jgi:hypothetical protein
MQTKHALIMAINKYLYISQMHNNLFSQVPDAMAIFLGFVLTQMREVQLNG